MPGTTKPSENYEISPRFAASIQVRIQRLERDAVHDELMIATLQHEDHIRRQRRLVAVQIAEALRMRLFLERSSPRPEKPLTQL